ncbi:MAG: trehalose/maltose transport system substrate-binding protein [Solirubrobacteraceae bacterium]|jgi:multiple sugar transport system substrate-binding protein|nr:trehalose/maltose transport system substrate-binding protein [Solirubrobacteraceae bacterium]
MMARRRFATGLVVTMSLFAAACGSSSSGGGSSSSSSGTSSGGGGNVSGAKVIDASSMNSPPKGTVKFCQGKDTTGIGHQLVKDFTAKYGSQGWKATLTEFPASADQQRAQFIQRQQAKSDDCDVFSSDVIWTAEFASQKWLYDLTPYVNQQRSKYIGAPLETVHYGGKYWGVPETSDAAFLFYRTDKGSGTAPTTWQQVYSQAAKEGGIVYQGAPYEGLTCDYLELAFAAGGQVLSPDGKKSAINSSQNVKALQLMVSGIKSGAAPKAVTTYMEPETDQAWASGRYGYMRNWTYAYAVANSAGSKVKGKYKVAPLPSFEGGGKAGILGGHNSVISVYTKNPGLALKFADFYASPEFQKIALLKYSQAAIIPATYSDPDVKKAIPYAAQLLQALSQAKARPVSPVYPQISQAIYKNVNDALAGRVSPQDALKKADSQINAALSTF